jgi:hypothetical protein
MNDSAALIAFIVLVGLIVLISGALNCGQNEQCQRMAEERGCISGTAHYDDEGECECQTRHGELEWDLHSGCSHDHK